MDAIERDLGGWIPVLLDVWRRSRRLPEGPRDRLLPHELREVTQAVRKISAGLTGARTLAGTRYMDDPRLLGAYLLYYWPNSYAQARHVLRPVFASATARAASVLDLGSGPGPVAFAALDAGAGRATAADRSAGALELARTLAAERGELLSLVQWNAANQPIPEGKFALITVGHLVNELWQGQPDAVNRRAGLIERAFGHLEPGGRVVVIEPALRETSRGTLEMRDCLLTKGIVPVWPCLFREGCPALARETDWCHSELAWEPPRLLADIAKAAGLHKESLKMTAIAFMRAGEAPDCGEDGCIFRIVSEPLASKGRQRFMGCGARGRIGLSLQTKHITESNRRFGRLRRGDLVRIEGFEEKGDGLALLPESRVDFVS